MYSSALAGKTLRIMRKRKAMQPICVSCVVQVESGVAETSPVGYLDRLFEHFEAAYNQQDGGWGQFLNGAPQHPQVGLYGTAAGGIVYGAADRVSTPAATAALQTLRSWWSSGDQ